PEFQRVYRTERERLALEIGICRDQAFLQFGKEAVVGMFLFAEVSDRVGPEFELLVAGKNLVVGFAYLERGDVIGNQGISVGVETRGQGGFSIAGIAGKQNTRGVDRNGAGMKKEVLPL